MAEGSPTAGMQVDGAELARRMIVSAEAAASAAQSTAAIVKQMKAGGGEKDGSSFCRSQAVSNPSLENRR